MGKKIFIHSVERETATGLSEWRNDTSGRKLKKTKFGRCDDGIPALYNPKFGGLANGLSYKPWTEDGVQKEENGRKLTLQDKLERKWNLPDGYLHNRPLEKSEWSKPESERSYYQNKAWKFQDGSTILDLDVMEDELCYYMILDSKFVANSEKELREHKWPHAMFYIAMENEAEELRFKKNAVKSRAFAALESENLTPTWKEKLVYILDLASTRAKVTTEQAHNLLFDFVDKSDFMPGSNIDKFMELIEALKVETGRIELEAKLLLKTAIDNRIVYEKQGSYNWARPDGVLTLGETYNEAVEFLTNPKKTALVEDLEQEIKLKLG